MPICPYIFILSHLNGAESAGGHSTTSSGLRCTPGRTSIGLLSTPGMAAAAISVREIQHNAEFSNWCTLAEWKRPSQVSASHLPSLNSMYIGPVNVMFPLSCPINSDCIKLSATASRVKWLKSPCITEAYNLGLSFCPGRHICGPSHCRRK